MVTDSDSDVLGMMIEVGSGNDWFENEDGPGGRDVGRGGELWMSKDAGPA